MIRLRAVCMLWLALLIGACSSVVPPKPIERPPPRSAIPAQPDGVFAAMEASIHSAHGSAASGFKLLDRNEDGLRWRLALVDSARHSIDLQYYLWYGDAAGLVLLEHVLAAADRGVQVRILVDDLNTLLTTSGDFHGREGAVLRADRGAAGGDERQH